MKLHSFGPKDILHFFSEKANLSYTYHIPKLLTNAIQLIHTSTKNSKPHVIIFIVITFLWTFYGYSQATTPFDCSSSSGTFYQVISGELRLYNPIDGTYDSPLSTLEFYNAGGYNSTDNFIYAIVENTQPTLASHLIRIDSNGNFDDLGILDETAPNYIAGDTDNGDNLYLRDGRGLRRIDNISTLPANPTATITTTFLGNAAWNNNPGPMTPLDIVFINGSFYGVDTNNLFIWNLITGNRSIVTVSGLPIGGSENYGAVYTDSSDRLYISNNDGGLYVIEDYITATPSASYLSSSQNVTRNDGFSCPFSPSPIDQDSDNILNPLDLDIDGDGITNEDESPSDPFADEDGDLIFAYIDDDDSVATGAAIGNVNGTIEAAFDTDGDGVPDFFDLDSDNDGIYDVIEAGHGIPHTDGRITGHETGSGANGLFDGVETSVDSGTISYTIQNSDISVIPDFQSTDADGDTCPDAIEGAGSFVAGDLDTDDSLGDVVDQNGVPSILGSPQATTPAVINAADNSACAVAILDIDNDNVDDTVDLDDDNDGILDTVEDENLDGDNNPFTNPTDTDNDGIPNFQDIDSDNDGIPDNVEAQNTSTYIAPIEDSPITPINEADIDGDGLNEAYEGSGDQGVTPINTDGTDELDYLDTDTDNDGVIDTIEAGFAVALTNNDDDNDGLLDAYEGADSDDGFDPNDEFDNGSLDTQNTDGADEVDYRDIDDDNDGVNTLEEDINMDGNPINEDSDNDGVADYLDTDDDGDGVATAYENPNPDGDGDPLTGDTQDTDEDGIPDYLDIDDDGDNILTTDEHPNPDNDGDPNTGATQDTDNDDTPDYLDIDDDGDDVNTIEEDYNGNDPLDEDTDNDGIPDYLDDDDDNDGILTIDESPDPNGDGNPDDAIDSDNNGIPDYLEPNNNIHDSDSEDGIVVFNGFSPNGDGTNDVLVVQGIENLQNTFMVYNRWGLKVYETDNYGRDDNFFRGISNGESTIKKSDQLPAGTYYFVIEYALPSGERKNRMGYLYINR